MDSGSLNIRTCSVHLYGTAVEQTSFACSFHVRSLEYKCHSTMHQFIFTIGSIFQCICLDSFVRYVFISIELILIPTRSTKNIPLLLLLLLLFRRLVCIHSNPLDIDRFDVRIKLSFLRYALFARKKMKKRNKITNVICVCVSVYVVQAVPFRIKIDQFMEERKKKKTRIEQREFNNGKSTGCVFQISNSNNKIERAKSQLFIIYWVRIVIFVIQIRLFEIGSVLHVDSNRQNTENIVLFNNYYYYYFTGSRRSVDIFFFVHSLSISTLSMSQVNQSQSNGMV